MSDMSEGEYLGYSLGYDTDEWEREQKQDKYYDNVNKMLSRYRDNKTSQVGTTIRCACCSRRILKKSYQTQFCSNKGKGNCKDTYWNNVSDKRRERSWRVSK